MKIQMRDQKLHIFSDILLVSIILILMLDLLV